MDLSGCEEFTILVWIGVGWFLASVWGRTE